MMLFLKECRRIVYSKIYLLFFAAVFFFSFYTQIWSDMATHRDSLGKPEPGGEDYGIVMIDDPEVLTQESTAQLLNDLINNEFTTYPYGFIHVVHLKGSDKEKLSIILQKLTGLPDPEAYVKNNCKIECTWGGTDEVYTNYEIPKLNVLSRMSIEDFRALMTEADNILGGGSSYSPDRIDEEFCLGPMSYEQALERYNELIEDDKVTNGYARLFCDYHGIFMVLFPVFLIAVYHSADKRSKMEQLIYTSSISSVKLTLTRFAALVSCMMLPVLFTAVLCNFRVMQFYGAAGLDHFAMIKYSLIWILPTVIAVTGIGMLLMNLIHPIAVVLIQFAAWFFLAMMGPLSGHFGVFDIIIRHNTQYGRSEFMDSLPVFIENRVFFTVLGLVCAFAASFVWDLRRGGKLGGNKMPRKLFARKS